MSVFDRKKYPEGAVDRKFNTANTEDVYAGPEFFEKPAEEKKEISEDVKEKKKLFHHNPFKGQKEPIPVFEKVYAGPPMKNKFKRPPVAAVYAGPEPTPEETAMIEGVYAGPATMLVYAGPDYWNPKPNPQGAFVPVDSNDPQDGPVPSEPQRPVDPDPANFCAMCGAPRTSGKFCPECGFRYSDADKETLV